MPDGGRRERATAVRTAPVVALVLARCPVVDALRRSRAVVPAATQLGVERVEGLRADGAGLRPTEERADVQLQVPGVGAVRGRADVEGLQVPVEQLVQRRARPRAALLVDGVEEPRPRGLSAGLLPRPGSITSTRVFRFPETGSWPPYTRTRRAPLGRLSIVPRCLRRPAFARVMGRGYETFVSRNVSRGLVSDLAGDGTPGQMRGRGRVRTCDRSGVNRVLSR
ncbi:hypothetical protein GCM10025792_41810 [Pseudonocardia tropica]